ncbi:alpha/beta hydrolase [Simiduia sp. 21SJ11W-1]|uniref:alpha/beta fold hydrolase n=1 Tax=Simiduia sp. 21SJ11W-1 TaxID=2909669 RepID=UPI00209DBB12|nr:alpha/beta fold hydrolase [Simiduia sp. 21SJ11W-1]UTA46432.1 alpha/beta hydrolase [Simiduia sp. 21SJ11W-1]
MSVKLRPLVGMGCVLIALLLVALLVARLMMQWAVEPQPAAVDGHTLLPVDCWFEAEPNVQCYRFEVVEAGQQFNLPVVVLQAAKPQTPGTQAVLYLSGGPGGSAFLSAEDMTYWQAQYQRLALNADLVLVDRRGTGLATPALQCRAFRRTYRRLLSKNYSAERENDAIHSAMSLCFEQHLSAEPAADRIAVSALGTQADTRDMQALMMALSGARGYQQWHLWGVSYGTRLALAIAEQHAQITPADSPVLRSLVLDSVYPPGRGSDEEWPVLMSEAMQRFFQWCDRQACTEYHAATWPSEQLFQQVLARLDRHPVSLSLPSWYGEAPYTLVVNGQRFLQIVFGAIYDQYLWPQVGKALRQVPLGDDEALARLSENFINNAFDPIFSELVFYAAECKDNRPVHDDEIHAALAQSPHYRRYLEGQMQWDVCAVDLFERVRGSEQLPLDLAGRLPMPVLLLNGAIDPITPAHWLTPLQQQLPVWQSAVFSEVGHAVVASHACAEQLLASFLANPLKKLRAQGEGCQADQVQLKHGPGVL